MSFLYHRCSCDRLNSKALVAKEFDDPIPSPHEPQPVTPGEVIRHGQAVEETDRVHESRCRIICVLRWLRVDIELDHGHEALFFDHALDFVNDQVGSWSVVEDVEEENVVERRSPVRGHVDAICEDVFKIRQRQRTLTLPSDVDVFSSDVETSEVAVGKPLRENPGRCAAPAADVKHPNALLCGRKRMNVPIQCE